MYSLYIIYICLDRAAFGAFVTVALDYFSWKFLRFQFLDILVERLQDKIPVVKLTALASLPYLVRSFSMPIDAILKERIEACIKEISEGKGKDKYTGDRLIRESLIVLAKLKETQFAPKYEPKGEQEVRLG